MNNKLSVLKNRFFPSFFSDTAPTLIEFFGHYLEWLDLENNAYYNISKLADYTDIDNTIDAYAVYLKSELMKDFPIELIADTKTLMRNLVQLYRSKGTESSLKFFFKALYNSFCEISYPREHILKTSDGIWQSSYYVLPEDIESTDLLLYLGMYLEEDNNSVSGHISKIESYIFSGESESHIVFDVIDNKKSFAVGSKVNIKDPYTGEVVREFTVKNSERSPEQYVSKQGFLDEASYVLQDSYFYQNFSYLITAEIDVNTYREVVTKLFNPAGMIFFGNVDFKNSVSTATMPVMTFIQHLALRIYIDFVMLNPTLNITSNLRMYSVNIDNLMPINSTNQWRFYNKKFGAVLDESWSNNVGALTPIDLETHTESSSKIALSNNTGLLIDADWINRTIEENEYTILNINPSWRKETHIIGEDNTIKIKYININLIEKSFIFVNGNYINTNLINVTAIEDGIIIDFSSYMDLSSNKASLYFYDDNTLELSMNINGPTILPSYINKKYIVVFNSNRKVNNFNLDENNLISLNEPYENCVVYAFKANELNIINNYITQNNKLIYKNKIELYYA